ncbi:MAG: sigma-70 family RNA polymerase sigma factor [Fimbriimonadales bacterium]
MLNAGAAVLRKVQPDSAAEMALVERCRRKDFDAFGRIVDAYQNRVFGFVRRMVGDADDAADVTQEVFVRAFQAFDRFDGRSSLRTWLFRIAHNLCIDRARRLDRAPAASAIDASSEDDVAMEIPDGRWDPESVILNDELMGVVESTIAAMSDKLRSVLILHDREDMAYEEIAGALDLPVGTVKSRLFLARAQLQQALIPYLSGGVNLK